MANASQVFKDDEDERVQGIPSDKELQHITGIGDDEEGAMDREARSDADDDLADQEKGFYSPGSDNAKADSGSNKPVSPAGLAAAEGITSGGEFNFSGNDQTRGMKVKSLLRANRKKALIGGGVVGGVGGIIALIFFMLIPLKIENMVNNLQNHFFASSENAVSNESESILSGYIRDRVLSGYSKCGSTIDRHCSAISRAGTDPISRLYNDWANERFETKLADDYGISFEKHSDGKWAIITPTTGKDGINIGENGEGLDTVLTSNQGDVRQAYQQALEGETKWKEVFYRYKVGRLLEEKYGVRRCLNFCGVTDPLQKNINDQKIAAKLYLNERVFTPMNEVKGLALKCLLDPSCQPNNDASQTSQNPAENGTSESSIEAQADGYYLSDLATDNGVSAEALQTAYEQLEQDGIQKTVIKQVIGHALGVDLSDNATVDGALDKIPIIGWINMGTQLINAGNGAGAKIKYLSFMVNSGAAVKVWEMYNSYADEIHTGNVSATEVGSMVDSLGPGNNGTSNNPQIGGTAGAEQTPLYASLMNSDSGTSSSTTSLLDGVLPTKAYADASTASNSSSSYTCNNGQPVPSGQLVCNEEVLNAGNGEANDIHHFLELPGVDILSGFSNLWGKSIGQVFNFVGSTLGKLLSGLGPLGNLACKIGVGDANPIFPGYCTFKDNISKIAQPLMQDFANLIIPNFISENMSGGRTFDAMAAGADVSGNAVAHDTIGGQQLTNQQVAENLTDQQTEAQTAFAHQSFFARMFSTASPYSLVSRMAMATPLDVQASAQSSFASLISNPFGMLEHSFSSIFSSKASAAPVLPQSDSFGVAQYGYPDNSPLFSADAETEWTQNCSDGPDGKTTQLWNSVAQISAEAGNTDADGQPTNTFTDPCLLINTAVGALGGADDTSLLSQDDLADLDNSGDDTSPTSPTAGNAQQLAQQILKNPNIDLSSYSASVKQDIQDAADGKPGTAGAMTSAAILQLIETVGQSHKVLITAIQSDGQGHCNGEPESVCPNDPHYNGDAVDFGSLDGIAITGRNAPALTIIGIATSLLPSGSGLGQSQCGSTPTLPPGWTTFQDTCDHLHVQVPKGTP